MKQKPKKNKVITIILVIYALLILTIGILYINLKNFTVKKVVMDDNQEIYLMGTFHKNLFKPYYNYSIDEMMNAIHNIDPDVILIEAREENFTNYGVVDGPIDMCIVYSYCKDNGIPVGMIDYWKIDNDFKENTTNTDRDDHIHDNIMKTRSVYKDKKILVVCGFGHLQAQTKRLVEDGGKKRHIANKSALFKGKSNDFIYPSDICDVWEKRVYYYGHILPKLVWKDNSLSDEIKASWKEDTDNEVYNWQMQYTEMFKKNEIYLKRVEKISK